MFMNLRVKLLRSSVSRSDSLYSKNCSEVNMKKFVRKLAVGTGAVSAAVLGVVTQVSAAVPEEATKALTTAGTDVNTIGWAVFGLLVAAASFKYMRRAL
ncbi:major capsid protein [Pseudomonas aeruginosa]|uniref:major capsid protein n=1 Tax=Pseudomonas aeruginosa TaxID=287 RepID=UPI00277D15F1|nr:major capsid protein [Pseudomonas aeruginosa]